MARDSVAEPLPKQSSSSQITNIHYLEKCAQEDPSLAPLLNIYANIVITVINSQLDEYPTRFAAQTVYGMGLGGVAALLALLKVGFLMITGAESGTTPAQPLRNIAVFAAFAALTFDALGVFSCILFAENSNDLAHEARNLLHQKFRLDLEISKLMDQDPPPLLQRSKLDDDEHKRIFDDCRGEAEEFFVRLQRYEYLAKKHAEGRSGGVSFLMLGMPFFLASLISHMVLNRSLPLWIPTLVAVIAAATIYQFRTTLSRSRPLRKAAPRRRGRSSHDPQPERDVSEISTALPSAIRADLKSQLVSQVSITAHIVHHGVSSPDAEHCEVWTFDCDEPRKLTAALNTWLGRSRELPVDLRVRLPKEEPEVIWATLAEHSMCWRNLHLISEVPVKFSMRNLAPELPFFHSLTIEGDIVFEEAKGHHVSAPCFRKLSVDAPFIIIDMALPLDGITTLSLCKGTAGGIIRTLSRTPRLEDLTLFLDDPTHKMQHNAAPCRLTWLRTLRANETLPPSVLDELILPELKHLVFHGFPRIGVEPMKHLLMRSNCKIRSLRVSNAHPDDTLLWARALPTLQTVTLEVRGWTRKLSNDFFDSMTTGGLLPDLMSLTLEQCAHDIGHDLHKRLETREELDLKIYEEDEPMKGGLF
ncbi:hypothetical protein C8F04DRAFT_1143807, partial [Mycena alexandri]